MSAASANHKTPIYKVLYFQVICAIVIGILLGFLAPEIGAQMKPFGDGFIRLIKMIIAPVIFCTVVTGIAGMEDMKKVGKTGGLALLYFEVVSTIALIIGLIIVSLGTLSALGYGPLAEVTIIGMQFLDFFDFLTNTVMMPIAAIATCLLVSRVIGVEKIEAEVTADGAPFKRKKIFAFMIRFLCPVFAAIILISSIANAFGWISM